MNLKNFHVPNYYKDREGREYATNYLESLSYGALKAVIIEENLDKALHFLAEICDIRFKPKFLDDTAFVVVSRLHPAITAAEIIRKRYGLNLNIAQAYILEAFSFFLEKFYIKFCRKLHRNIFHSLGNHGAIGIMGEVIAVNFLLPINTEKHLKRLMRLRRKLNRHLKIVVKKNGELWVENLRTKSGLYYTYLHLAAILRAKMVLESYFYGNEDAELPKPDFIFSQAISRYLVYYQEPDTWPYMEMTKIPILRQLQKLIFPSGKEFKKPRPEGKEGAFVDFLNKAVMFNTLDVFAPQDVYFEVEGPFPFSSYFVENIKELI